MLKFREIYARLLRSRFLRSVVTLASASGAGQLIVLAALPLLTRLYTPQEFGVLAVFSAMMGVTVIVAGWRYEMAIPLPRSSRDAAQILVLTMGLNLASAAIAAAAVALLRHDIAGWTQTPAMATLLWLLPVAIVTAGSYRALNFFAVRNRQYRRIAQTRISQNLASVAAQLVGGVAGFGGLGLVVGQIVGQSVGVSRLARGIGLGPLYRQTRRSPLRSRLLLRRYKRFPAFDVPAAGLNALSAQLPNFALAALFTPQTAGLYYLAERVLQTPMTMVGQAVAQVLYGQCRDDIAKNTLGATLLRLLLVMAGLVAVVVPLIFFFAESAFVLFFGEAWRTSGSYAAWLIAGLGVQFVYSPLSMALMATEGQVINLAIHSLIFVLKLAALLAGYYTNNALLAVQGLSLALCVGYGTGIVIIYYRTTRREQ